MDVQCFWEAGYGAENISINWNLQQLVQGQDRGRLGGHSGKDQSKWAAQFCSPPPKCSGWSSTEHQTSVIFSPGCSWGAADFPLPRGAQGLYHCNCNALSWHICKVCWKKAMTRLEFSKESYFPWKHDPFQDFPICQKNCFCSNLSHTRNGI